MHLLDPHKGRTRAGGHEAKANPVNAGKEEAGDGPQEHDLYGRDREDFITDTREALGLSDPKSTQDERACSTDAASP
jgi:hypothetical protein